MGHQLGRSDVQRSWMMKLMCTLTCPISKCKVIQKAAKNIVPLLSDWIIKHENQLVNYLFRGCCHYYLFCYLVSGRVGSSVAQSVTLLSCNPGVLS